MRLCAFLLKCCSHVNIVWVAKPYTVVASDTLLYFFSKVAQPHTPNTIAFGKCWYLIASMFPVFRLFVNC